MSVLDQLIRETPALWRGRGGQPERPGANAVDTGFTALNTLLPTGGWPLRALTEFSVAAWGSGELQLLLPLMARLTQDQIQVAMVAPPYQPYAPALAQAGVCLPYLVVVNVAEQRGKDIWWSAEKLLRHPDCGLVLLWPAKPHPAQIRRLQLAADAANNIGVVLGCGRPVDTPVALRLSVSRCTQGIQVAVTKSRFGWRQHGAVVLEEYVPYAQTG
ncbi:MAG: translesion DNA synthesis-associated protein ImuA, partial [Gammaproteobacteria bacterium]